MKKSLRIALAVAVLASLAPIALAAPGGTIPPPPPQSSFAVIVSVILSVLGL